jgi:hypothetical protein
MTPPADRITMAEAARQHSMNSGSVYRLVQKTPGLKGEDGLVDVIDFACAVVNLKAGNHHNGQRGGINQPPRMPDTSKALAARDTILQGNARKATATADAQEIKVRRASGELVERSAVLALNAEIIAAARNRLTSLADVLSGQLSNQTEEAVAEILGREIAAVLDDLARLVEGRT